MSSVEVSPEAIEKGRVFCAQAVEFVRGVPDLRQLPPENYPEIAFAGRSNVGKSSLINALLNRKNLARASGEPGRTRELNYFLLAETIYVVDLPGYGYAKASKAAIKAWTSLTRMFLQGRSTLQRVFLLIDSRRGVLDADRDMMELLDQSAVVYQIVLTKADKLKARERETVFDAVRTELAKRPAAHPLVHFTSSETGLGLPELRHEIAQLAGV